MEDLLKHLLPEWISLAIVLIGIWVSIGRNLVTKAEVEKMIQCLSPYNVDKQFIYERLDMNKEMVLFCAGGMRSALAAKTLKDMGFEKVSHIDGGFGAIRNSKFKIV